MITPKPIPDDQRFAPLVGPRESVLQDLHRMRDMGVGHVALWPMGERLDSAGYMKRLDQIAEQILPEFTA